MTAKQLKKKKLVKDKTATNISYPSSPLLPRDCITW